MNHIKSSVLFLFLIGLLFSAISCNMNKTVQSNAPEIKEIKIEDFRSGGGSSGMEQIGPQSYLVVYDVKNFKKGTRMGLVKLSEEALDVYPIEISTWDAEGISSDLESICAIPGKKNEFLIAESGNWQGKLGRVFHIKVDTTNLSASVLGSVRFPQLHRNDFGMKGDQYEAMLCLPFKDDIKIVLFGERGGSKNNPNGVIRWGKINLDNHTLIMNEKGLNGVEVKAPGNWTNDAKNRDIADFHLDNDGNIWAASSEDQGDTGPFYSVVYKLGKVNHMDENNPVMVNNTMNQFKEIHGFKIEALSGPCKGINSNLSFGTEDEIYGGVWRPLNMAVEK